MRILNQRIYIVTSPPLAAAVQRASKALSFTPIVPEVTKPVFGLDDTTMEIVCKNLDPGPGDEPGYLSDIQGMIYNSLGPGQYLSDLTLKAVRELRDEVASYAASPNVQGSGARTDLLLWVRHLVTVSTARYLYGPENPIAREPDLEDAFWDFDHGLIALMVNFYPSVTARRAYRGRERLAAALEDYLLSGRHETSGSRIIRSRVELALRHGWTLRAAARSEISFLFAGIVNTTTTTFWILARLYADAGLLETVRDEVTAAIDEEQLQMQVQQREPSADASGGHRLRIPGLRERCPTLVAVYSECLRLGSDNFSNRKVKEDTMLADRYLLKKDAIVQIAGGVIHADEGIWGDDVETFKPGRFLNGTKGQQPHEKPQQRHPAAFRAFGGGKTLCPGRHFAQNEILTFVALVVLQLDMAAPGGGDIKVPKKKDTGMPVHILEPEKPVEVVIRSRAKSDSVDLEDIEFSMD